MNISQLEQEICTFRKEIESNLKNSWWIREKYIDLGRNNNPIFSIDFTDNVKEPGDDLLDEPLFNSAHPHLKIKLMTRLKYGAGRSYWLMIKKDELITRLDRFLSMYRENYIQPPGNRSITKGIIRPHPRIEGRCFNYQITSPGHKIVGIAPKKCVETLGAISGRVLDKSENPLSGVKVELRLEKTVNEKKDAFIIHRTTNAKGQFWFSKIPLGDNIKGFLKIKEKQIKINMLKLEPFGKIRGKLLDNKMNPRVLNIKFCSPDGEIFKSQTDNYGQFKTASLPAFPYKTYIQGFGIRVNMIYSGDSHISGVIKDKVGKPIKNSQIILKSDGNVIDKKMTGSSGHFIFENLWSGVYTIEIPENRISLKGSGKIQGNIKDVNNAPIESQIIHLIRTSDKKIIDIDRTDKSGNFKFFELEPGSYIIRIPSYKFIKK